MIYASRTSGITENNQNEAGHVQTIVRLTKDNYSVFGETETIPLNLDSLEKLPYIEDMRDEEYADLLAKLRAGKFYEERYILDKEHFQPNGELKGEYVQQFKTQNFAGLLIIKNKMREYIDSKCKR